MRVGLLETALTDNGCPDSFGAPAVIPESGTICCGAAPVIVRSAIGSSVGGSFTASTVRTKLVRLLPWSASATVTVMVALPNKLVAGRRFTVRLLPLPPKERLGNRAGL